MEFRVLGRIEASQDGTRCPVAAGHQLSLLALLLVHANRTVRTDRILEDLWGDEPPSSGAKTVGFHVSRLRDALAPDRGGEAAARGNGREVAARGEAAAGGNGRGPILTVEGGYLLRVDPDSVDATRFERLAAEGHALLASDPATAADRLRAALGEWDGPAYVQVADFPFAQTEATRLDELRLRAQEDAFDAALALGRQDEVAEALAAHVATNPLREHPRATLVTALYRTGRQAEALRVLADGRTTLADELGVDPGPELRRLETWILQQDARLDHAGVQPDRAIRNPYKGLRPFGEADAPDFFGRETMVDALVERLGQLARGSRLLMLIGPSGSGKSSVALAGLLSAVRRGVVPALAGASVEVLVPGPHPRQDLAAAVERLRSEAAPMGLLVVDQLDELPSVAGDAGTTAFLHALEDALAAEGPPLVAIVTLRADRIDLPLAVPGLAERVRTGTEIVAPLSRHDLERAVSRPAERVGLMVEPGLPHAIAADVGSQPAALPLLQVALTELFERRDGDRLTRAAYVASGGVAGALAARAEDAWAALDRGDREIARHLFLHLVAITDTGEPAVRRRSRADLDPLADDAGSLDRVLEVLARRRLLGIDVDATSGDAVVSIAHGALLTNWPRCAGWIREARDDLAMRRRLADATAEWEAAGRDAGFLLTGSRLDLFGAWASTTSLRLDPHERALLDASLADRRAAEEAERARAERERRLERRASTRMRALAAVLAAGILAASSLSIALYRQGTTATEEARVAVARERAAAAVGTLGSDPRLALVLAWHAADATADLGYVTAEAYDALHWSLQALHVAYPPDTQGTAVRMGPDGPTGVPLLLPEELMAMAAAEGLEPLGASECRTYLHQESCPLPPARSTGGGPVLGILRDGSTAPASALGTGGLEGTTVDVVSQLPMDATDALSSLLAGTGITVRTSTDDATGSVLADRLARGPEPDIAIVAAPRTMAGLAADGLLVDLSTLGAGTSPAVAGSAYLDGLMRVGDGGSWPAAGGRLRGVPLALTDESLLWTASSEEPGVMSPRTWGAVTANARDAASAGRAGWCLGLAGDSAGASDIVGVFEDGLLDLGGVATYDAWASDPESIAMERGGPAFARVLEVADPSLVLGGLESAALTPPEWAAWPMFASPSRCLYHPGGGQDRLEWPAGSNTGLTAVPVPGTAPDTAGPVRGRAYIVVVLHDRPEVRSLLRHLLDPAAGADLDSVLAAAGLWRPGGADGPAPERDLLAAAVRNDTFRVRLQDIAPAPVSEALAQGLETYLGSPVETYTLFAGGIRQAWARVALDGGE